MIDNKRLFYQGDCKWRRYAIEQKLLNNARMLNKTAQ